MNRHFITAAKGFLMGAANVIPGVSGGTVALITGIYSRLIESISSFTLPGTWKDLLHLRLREFFKDIDGAFLLAVGSGILLSVVSLARLMTLVLERFPVQTWAFFFGLILSSAVIMLRGIGRWNAGKALMSLAGAALGVGVCMMTPSQTPDNLWFIFICGALAICTMILPGISGSFVLLIMGKYDHIMSALDLAAPNIPVIAVFGAGCIVGILAFAKFLHWVLGRWEVQTMTLLLGFIIGSLIKVWPWQSVTDAGLYVPAAPGESIGWALLWCAAGLGVVLGTDFIGRKKKEK